METLMKNLNRSVEEDDDLVIELDDLGDCGGNIDLCLVGKFLSEQSTKFNILRSRMASV